MTELETLEQSLQTLLTRFSSLQDENFALHEENERQREEILRSHAELLKLQSEHRNLLIAKGLTGDSEEQIKAKQHLTNLIASIDRVIEILKQ